MSNAPAEISWPAVATGTPSEKLISLSVPGTTMTPVPIMKLPNNSDQRTAGSAARRAPTAVVVFTKDPGGEVGL
jgi:hypothetical protein